MSNIDKTALAALRTEVQNTQSTLPEHSLDWNIYQGQLDLLSKVEALVTEEAPVKAEPKKPQAVKKITDIDADTGKTKIEGTVGGVIENESVTTTPANVDIVNKK